MNAFCIYRTVGITANYITCALWELSYNQQKYRAQHLQNLVSLHWRHNECDGVLNHQPHDCLLDRLFMRRSKKTSKLRVTGLCVGNSPVTGEFPAQRASNRENTSIWWRHHAYLVSHIVHMSWLTDWGLNKWLTICRRHLQMHNLGKKWNILIKISPKFDPMGPTDKMIMGSHDGLMLVRFQTIMWTSIKQVMGHHMASIGFNELSPFYAYPMILTFTDNAKYIYTLKNNTSQLD